ncbi:MAG: hypothetical protein ACJAXQ_001524 [Parvibaculaceae bacterium]|jgi:hypothetical protein
MKKIEPSAALLGAFMAAIMRPLSINQATNILFIKRENSCP